jgi:acetylornithine deacetylase/succinyl-diaminopimelate desuccinylase-like protein
MKRTILVTALLLAAATTAVAQGNLAANAARQWREQHERAIVDEFFSLLAIPNVARDKENIKRNADMLVSMMEKRGISARQVSVAGANPVVYGEIKSPGATRTIVFYAHYDGQPLDPKEWATPPFSPVLKGAASDEETNGRGIPLPPPGARFDPESRIYARAAADDKAPIMALMTALDAIRAASLSTKSNIKFAFEGEEEAGSPNFARILSANKQLFSGDVWLGLDGPVHQSRRQSIIFGARGISVVNLTVYGPRNELHSGHYGNWAPNPAMMLARLLASMKDDDGRVLVNHFYDGIEPLSATERAAIAEIPDYDAELMRQFWLGATERAPRHLAELIMEEPSLNIRGMGSARTGAQASNVIPASATASIDMRLVKGMDPKRTADLLIEHIRRQGYFVSETEPDESMRRTHPKVAWVEREQAENPHRTPMDTPIAREVIRALESIRGPIIKIPTSGATGPDAADAVLGMPSIGIPIANHDDNQHSFDENLRIQNLWDGIEVMAVLLTM